MPATLLYLTTLVGLSSARTYPILGNSMYETRQANGDGSFGTPPVTAANPFDHSWIESFTALGDSYSVGLGAGHAVSAAKGVSAAAIIGKASRLTRCSLKSTPIARNTRMGIQIS